MSFVAASRIAHDPESLARIAELSPPTSDTRVIVALAVRMMEHMHQPGGVYTKSGVMLENLVDTGTEQTDLFSRADPRAGTLMAAMDGLNTRFGREACVLGTQGIGARRFDTKRELKSPAWTTRLAEIPIAR